MTGNTLVFARVEYVENSLYDSPEEACGNQPNTLEIACQVFAGAM